MNNNTAHDLNDTVPNTVADSRNRSVTATRAVGTETRDGPVVVPVDDGPDATVSFISSKVYELTRAGQTYTVEVGWRVGELTLVDGQSPDRVPAWLADAMDTWFGVEEVTL